MVGGRLAVCIREEGVERILQSHGHFASVMENTTGQRKTRTPDDGLRPARYAGDIVLAT